MLEYAASDRCAPGRDDRRAWAVEWNFWTLVVASSGSSEADPCSCSVPQPLILALPPDLKKLYKQHSISRQPQTSLYTCRTEPLYLVDDKRRTSCKLDAASLKGKGHGCFMPSKPASGNDCDAPAAKGKTE